jgi:hypothetical protein
VPLDEADCADGSYVAAERCFGSREAACDCLGCSGNQCNVSEDALAKVTCGAK